MLNYSDFSKKPTLIWTKKAGLKARISPHPVPKDSPKARLRLGMRPKQT